jgi:hypothetical protein
MPLAARSALMRAIASAAVSADAFAGTHAQDSTTATSSVIRDTEASTRAPGARGRAADAAHPAGQAFSQGRQAHVVIGDEHQRMPSMWRPWAPGRPSVPKRVARASTPRTDPARVAETIPSCRGFGGIERVEVTALGR